MSFMDDLKSVPVYRLIEKKHYLLLYYFSDVILLIQVAIYFILTCKFIFRGFKCFL